MNAGGPISRENERDPDTEVPIPDPTPRVSSMESGVASCQYLPHPLHKTGGSYLTVDFNNGWGPYVGQHQVLKYFSLVALTLQNVLLIISMRYVRTRDGPMFMATSAVIMGEILKLAVCLFVIYCQQGSLRKFMLHLQENILENPFDFLKVSVPSLLYTLQNNLLYLAVSNLDPATFQVTYQLKILTTAIFSVLVLKKYLTPHQWMSLFILFVGVSIVQMQPVAGGGGEVKDSKQRPLIGLLAVIISAFMSGFSGVYFEKILKGTKQSLWIRNIQLGTLGTVMGFITMELKEGAKVRDLGFFYGYDSFVWFAIMLNSLGGLIVAVVVKYADNILKGFATSAAIIVSCIISILFLDFSLSLQFSCGAICVMISVYMYGTYAAQTPRVVESVRI